jgi:hypothetical protein
MGFGGGPEPFRGWIGVVITSRRSSMSNFAAMLFPASGILNARNGSTSVIIDGFSNSDYGFWEVSVEFCMLRKFNTLTGYSQLIRGIT